MSLSLPITPSFSICSTSDCKTLKFNETTGAYADDNTGGYGGLNINTTDIVAAVLIITPPNSTRSVTVNMLLQGFPSSDPLTPTFEITTTTLGPTTTLGLSPLGSEGALPDGWYDLNYTLTDSDGTNYTYTYSFLMTCTVACCVANLLAAVADCTCDCDDEAKETALFAYTMLVALKDGAGCQQPNKKQTNLLTALQRICQNKDCNCGCK